MTLFRTVPPATEPVTLAEAKAQLRVAHDSEDELIEGLIKAARDEVERTASLALIDQDWRLALDGWPRHGLIRLRRSPVKEVIAVTLYGSEGEATVLDPTDFELDPLSSPARLHFSKAPAPLRAMNGIEIDFRAGFGEAATDVPDLIKRAILLLVAHWYEFRASYGAASQPVSVPDGFLRLLGAYMPRRIA